MKTHRDGGKLIPKIYEIEIVINEIPVLFPVDGFQCEVCSEQVMSRDAAVDLEKRVAELRAKATTK